MVYLKDRLTDRKTRKPRERHAAVAIHADGSGAITIYQNGRLRGHVSLVWEDWRALRDEIDGRAADVDAHRLPMKEARA
jgi:hypothetical protein